MQVTIDIPDDLASRLRDEGKEIAEIIRRGLTPRLSNQNALAEDVIRFLGNGPDAQTIVAFRPSEESLHRANELLEKNDEGTLSPEERVEIDEICAWNRLFALIKAEARLHLQTAR